MAHLPGSNSCSNTAAAAAPALLRIEPGGGQVRVEEPRGTMASRAARSSGVGCQSAALTLARTCSGRVAPAMTDATAGWAASPPTATSCRPRWRSAAYFSRASTLSNASEVSQSARPTRRPPSAGEQATGERVERQHADAVLDAGGDDLLLDPALQQAVLVLRRDHAGAVLGQGDPVRVGDPEAGVVGGADVAHLALHDQLVEGGDRLPQWRLGIGAMLRVEVDVVGLEPAQAGLDRAPDVATGAAGLLLAPGDVRAELGGEHDLVTAALQDLAEEALGVAAAVGVGRVEQGDALLQRRLDHRAGLLQVTAVAEVVAAEPDHRDGQAGRAELAVAHAEVPSTERCRQHQ